jgi:hypothetical protein
MKIILERDKMFVFVSIKQERMRINIIKSVSFAIAGVGNCSSSLIQGIYYYKQEGLQATVGIMHPDIGGYGPCDIAFVAAFDIDRRKVGRPLVAAAPSGNQMVDMPTQAGFGIGGMVVAPDDDLQGPSHFDTEGPFKESLRNGDSTWALVSNGELTRPMDQIRYMNRDGRIDARLAEPDERCRRAGQTTFIFGRKFYS